jgi:sulfate permease, SulP family
VALAAPERPAPRRAAARWWVPPGLRGYRRSWLTGDVVAGLTLAAVAIPECMGYTRIVATPAVTGLYTLLLPIAGFALLGSSRHLVVGADSATAAILFAGLTGLAQPNSSTWLELASAGALLTAVLLVVARVVRLGFLADFLSRTVLVGFLSGVGVTLLVRELPDMLGLAVGPGDSAPRLVATARELPAVHLPTLAVAAGVLLVILLSERLDRRVPGALLAIALAIAAAWALQLDRYGVALVGSVPPGLPALEVPRVPLGDLAQLGATALSMFLVILAQSSATARSFAEQFDEPLDENRDLVALGAANALAGLSGTFVVNGSPTKTAVVAGAGGRTPLAQLVTAGATLAVLLVGTEAIAHLPEAALAALVFLIGAKLIDVGSLRQMYRLTRGAFAVAVGTLLGVVFLGVERGILLAIALSVLDHLRREYHPTDVVLTRADGHWKARPADPGAETAPGLIVYRFAAPLFFANADYFAARVQALVVGAPHPVSWLVLDLVSLGDVDYTGGLRLAATVARLQRAGITVALAEADALGNELERYGIAAQVGAGRIFPTVSAAADAFDAGTGGAPHVEPVAPAA